MGLQRPGATAAGAVLLAALMGACGSSEEAAGTGGEETSGALRVGKALSGSPSWVDFFRPELSAGGFNLALDNRRIPF